MDVDVELMLATDEGVTKEDDGVFASGLAFNTLPCTGGDIRFALRDVRNGEGVCGA